jgi:RNA polymerase sigma-70 factor, ECF subfamily
MAEPAAQVNLDQTLELAAAGDAAAWQLLVGRYTPRVYSLLVRQCGDRELAEEITQATFVKMVTHIGRYREQGRFEPWLFRIAMNRLRDEMRRRKRQARTMDMSPGNARDENRTGAWDVVDAHLAARTAQDQDPASHLSRAEQVEQLREAIAQLSKADQEMLHLRHTAELSFPQIAQTLNQPLGTVLARAHRAMGKLRKLLQQPEEDQPVRP